MANGNWKEPENQELKANSQQHIELKLLPMLPRIMEKTRQIAARQLHAALRDIDLHHCLVRLNVNIDTAGDLTDIITKNGCYLLSSVLAKTSKVICPYRQKNNQLQAGMRRTGQLLVGVCIASMRAGSVNDMSGLEVPIACAS